MIELLAEFVEVLSLKQYNTRLVILSTSLLAMTSGLIGSFLLLRKRSLMGDALSHATLPGVGLAFAVMVMLGGSGKALSGLWLGAILSGGLGVLVVVLIRKTTRLQDDVAMGLVLSVFFGAGIVIMRAVQSMPGGSAAGLETFIYGKTASIVFSDFVLIASVTLFSILVVLFLLKEFTLLCFDEHYGASQGWPITGLDLLLLGLVTAVTVSGLQSVGLILMIALFVIPAAAARFWSRRLTTMMWLSGAIGALSGWLGGSISALFFQLPAGAVIVLVSAFFFLMSLLFAPHRGIVFRSNRRRQLDRKVGEQHLLRAMFELIENATQLITNESQSNVQVQNSSVTRSQLMAKRSWSHRQLSTLIKRAKRKGYIQHHDGALVQLSEDGFGKASRITRNHRLWEIYLVTHADIAPSHVDRDADMIEHVLDADLVLRLEKELKESNGWNPVMPSQHRIPETV